MKLLGKLIKALRSNAAPGQIAGGVVLGMFLGLTPLMALHNMIIVLLLIILNVNLSMAIFGFLLFSGFAYLLDPLFHSIGFYLLADTPLLRGLWTEMYNIPVIAISGFNNTVVMGSFVSAIILSYPLFLFMKWFVVYYRENLETRIQKMKIVQFLKGSKIYGLYTKISTMGD